MAMRNMWWHFRILFGQTNFLWADSFSKLSDRMSDKLSWIFDMSEIKGKNVQITDKPYLTFK